MKRVVVFVGMAAALAAGCDRGSTGQSAGSANTRASESAAPSAPATPPAAPSAAAQPANDAAKPTTLLHPLLWAAKKDGKTSYLFGTMHVGIDAKAQLPSVVWTKLDNAPAFAMEADVDDASAAALIKPTTTSLHAALGDVYWKKLEGALGETMARALDHMPPMIPATALVIRTLPMTLAMDKVLENRASDEHKRIVFLEPAARQIAILTRWMDIKALKMMLDELPEGEQHTRDMVAAYLAGDDRAILTLATSERDDSLRHGYTAAEYDREMADVLYDRNASWIAPIEQLHAAGGGFIAVGALHLIGPRSVLDLLAHRGYRVTRIEP